LGVFTLPVYPYARYIASLLNLKHFSMKLTILAGLVTLAGFGLFSCQSPSGNTAPASAAMASPLDTVTANPHGGGGQYVPMAQITPCLQAYQTVMAQYGITTDSPSVPVTKCPPTTYRITLSESFTYLTLRHLLDSLAMSIDSAGHGANVNIQLMPGIISQELASAYNMPPSKVGRISYFLIPTLMGTSAVNAAKMKGAAPEGGGGGGGLEVGGLEP
jgi:hypothetical protein